ncbi:MAG: hypothetical protein DYH13_06655 [Alphaproteobacteria bacterium PRO2]|nr:hypothetical protein [Alphaproteobacteria bacterium PRO2]
MIALKKIFNYPFTVTTDEANAAVKVDRDAIMNWLDQHKIDINNVIKLYIAEKKLERLRAAEAPMAVPPRIVIRMDAQNSYKEKEIDFFGGWFNTLQAAFEDITEIDVGFASGLEKRLKHTIEAMSFVELELANGQHVGFNPRKFTVLEREAGSINRYIYSHVADEKGFTTAVKGYYKDIQKSFDDYKMLMASAEAYREKVRQERWGGKLTPHVNPYLKASKTDRQPQ